MQKATKAAIALVDEFTIDEGERASIKLCLSEAPIGDEYDVVEDSEWPLYEMFEVFAESRGVELFEEVRTSS